MKAIVFSGIIGIVTALIITLSPIKHTPAIQSVSAIVLNKPSTPVMLSIPSINVTAKVELVGQDSQRTLGVPQDENDVGWYEYGFKPGENGNAVIDGHVDSETGPAVFYNLNNLTPGDQLTITDKVGHTYTFVVNEKQTYDFDKVPMHDLFKPANTPHLNLITCTGVFDRTHKNYLQRTVIYTTLQQ